MKKRILMVGSIVFLLAACNGGGSSVTTSDDSSSDISETTSEHIHAPAENWSSDGTGHWKACNGCDEKLDFAEHTNIEIGRTLREDKSCYDVSYKCEVCDYESEGTAPYEKTSDDYFEELAAAKAKADADAAKGAVKSYQYSYTMNNSTTSGSFESGSYNGKAASKQTKVYNNSTTETYAYYEGESIVGYNVDAGNKISKYNANANDFKGIHFTSGFFSQPYNANIYDVNAIFDLIYNQIVANSNGDKVIGYSEGAYTYNLGIVYKSSPTYSMYYKASGSIAFDETTKAIKKYEAKFAQFFNNEVTIDDELGTFAVNEGVAKTYTEFTYEATFGDKGQIAVPYSTNDFKFTAFSLSYNGVAVAAGSTVEVMLSSTTVQFALVSKAPETASADFDAFSFDVKDAATDQAVSGVYPSFSAYSNSFNLPGAVGKTYNITIKTAGGVSFSFNIKGKAPAATGMLMGAITVYPSGASIGNMPSKVYIGKPVLIGATLQPNTADQSYTMVCKDADNNVVTLEKITGNNTMGNPFEYYNFNPTVAGIYTFTATSVETPTISKTASVTVLEAPSMDSVFAGVYYEINTRGGGVMEKITFAPNADTPEVDGTVTVIFNPGNAATEKTAIYSYTLNADGDGVDCTFVSGETNWNSLRFKVNADYSISAWAEAINNGQPAGFESQISLMDEASVPGGIIK